MKKKVLAVALTLVMAVGMLTGCGSGSSNASSQVSTGAAESTASQTAVSAETASTEAASAQKGDIPELPENIKEKGKLVIGVKADFAPFGYVDENGNNVGYDLEIGKKLAEYAFGDPEAVEFVIVTSSNRIPFLTSKKVDLLLSSMAITEERLQEIDFTNVYMSTGHLILTKADDDSIQGVDDLQDKTIICVDGTTGAAAAEKLCPDAKLMKYETWSEALSALKAGRGDAIIHDESVLYEAAASDSTVKTIGEAFENTWVAGGVRKGEEDWLAWINACMEDMQKEDFFNTEFQSFFDIWTTVPAGLPRAGEPVITPESVGF